MNELIILIYGIGLQIMSLALGWKIMQGICGHADKGWFFETPIIFGMWIIFLFLPIWMIKITGE